MATYKFDFDVGQRAFYINTKPMYRDTCRSCDGTGIRQTSICYECNMSGVGRYEFYPENCVMIWDIGKIHHIVIHSDGVFFIGDERQGLSCKESELFHTRKEAKDFCKNNGWKVVNDSN